ncbi:hypothetical protein GC167_03915 [bacterium]|nr:hypothetical protein [bacterium]
MRFIRSIPPRYKKNHLGALVGLVAAFLWVQLGPGFHALSHVVGHDHEVAHVHQDPGVTSVCSDEAHHSCDSCSFFQTEPSWAELPDKTEANDDFRALLVGGLTSGLWTVLRSAAADRGPPAR